MKERPILFSAPMVQAILDGRKTQTRRAVKPQPWAVNAVREPLRMQNGFLSEIRCPYGLPGDRLWVREAFRPIYPQDPTYNGGHPIEYDYREGYRLGNRMGDHYETPTWKPSIHMPRRASRITLKVTGIRVERLQDISETNAMAEGVEAVISKKINGWNPHVLEYALLWEKINGPGSWKANPWVWIIEFNRVQP